MKRIRVLYTIPNFDTAGSGKALLKLATGLNAEKFEPHILCFHDQGDFFETVRESGISVHIFPYVSPARPITKLLWSSWKVSRKLKEINPDIIHSFNYSSDYTEGMASKMAGIPYVFTKKNMGWLGPSIRAWKLRSYLAKRIVIQNTDMKKEFYPESDKTALIPRGVDTFKFMSGDRTQGIRGIMNTPENARVVICVANLVPVKGVEVLIESFSNLQHEFPKWVLWVIGDSNNQYGQSLIRKVSDLGMEKYIKFSGKQPNVIPYLREAELFVLPTKNEGRREGSPVALLEAMACGLTVIGSRIAGIKDQLKDFDELLFNPDVPNELTLLLKLYFDKSSRELGSIGKELQAYVREHYPIQLEVEKHEQLYLELLNLN